MMAMVTAKLPMMISSEPIIVDNLPARKMMTNGMTARTAITLKKDFDMMAFRLMTKIIVLVDSIILFSFTPFPACFLILFLLSLGY